MLARDTLVLTSCGHLPIGSLENQQVEVWNGQEFSSTVVVKTGTNKQLHTLVLDSGGEITLTPEHELTVQNAYWVHTLEAKKVSDLVVGEKLLKGLFPILETGTKSFPYAYTHGFYMGSERYHRNTKNVTSRAAVYGIRRPALEYLELDEKTDKVNLHFPSDMPDIFDTPLDISYSLETKLEWLSGLFDGGLVKRKADNSPIWHIYSHNGNFLKDLKLMFQTLGGDARVIKNQDMEKAPYSIRLSGVAMQNLRKMKLPTKTLTIPEINYYRRGYQMPRVVDVVDEGMVGDAFGFIEPKRRAGVFNGILLGDGYSN